MKIEKINEGGLEEIRNLETSLASHFASFRFTFNIDSKIGRKYITITLCGKVAPPSKYPPPQLLENTMVEIIKSKIQCWDGLVYEERVVRVGDILIFETIILGEVKSSNIYKKDE